MGYPLFNAFLIQYLAHPAHGKANTEAPPTSIVYRNYAITSMVGIPGSIVAWVISFWPMDECREDADGGPVYG